MKIIYFISIYAYFFESIFLSFDYMQVHMWFIAF